MAWSVIILHGKSINIDRVTMLLYCWPINQRGIMAIQGYFH